VILGTDGNYYGTTTFGGTSLGAVFKVTPDGTETILHAFSGVADGQTPYALVQGTDGNFYGTTEGGGQSGGGTLFKISPGGALTVLYSFGGSSGTNPHAELI
jgi:uncharacterized repeat protein (TIGR03803 family)